MKSQWTSSLTSEDSNSVVNLLKKKQDKSMWIVRHSVLPPEWKLSNPLCCLTTKQEKEECCMAVMGFSNRIPHQAYEVLLNPREVYTTKGDLAVLVFSLPTVQLTLPSPAVSSRPMMVQGNQELMFQSEFTCKLLIFELHPGEWIDQKISRPYPYSHLSPGQAAVPTRVSEILFEAASVPSNYTIYNLCCGTGACAEPFLQAGYNCVLVDTDRSLEAYLKTWIMCNKYKGRVEIQDFSETRFVAPCYVCAFPPLVPVTRFDLTIVRSLINHIMASCIQGFSLLIPHNSSSTVLSHIITVGGFDLKSRLLVSMILPSPQRGSLRAPLHQGMEVLTLYRPTWAT
ncbi:ORF4 [Tacheng Tick Virus 7]|uniref:RNA-directed RNA polymerase L n=1 Tax=Tacheng Tick Virus 7 TaxID=1608089 RepID=A0A0B5KRJ9_9RHAB|nr:ORF4 [Tacheng Tick Virus 7]AJG39146.1 ORF4 [Tacheng Tick Virus 7]